MSKKPAHKSDAADKPDLLMVVARAVERLTRIGDKELHAEIVAAIAAHEGGDDA